MKTDILFSFVLTALSVFATVAFSLEIIDCLVSVGGLTAFINQNGDFSLCALTLTLFIFSVLCVCNVIGATWLANTLKNVLK